MDIDVIDEERKEFFKSLTDKDLDKALETSELIFNYLYKVEEDIERRKKIEVLCKDTVFRLTSRKTRREKGGHLLEITYEMRNLFKNNENK